MSQVFDALKKAEQVRKSRTQTEMRPERLSTTSPPAPDPAADTLAYLGPGLRVTGQITGDGHLQIDGRVEGLISLRGYRLTIGQTAHVRANIVAGEVVVHGEVDGDLLASDRIEITKDASVTGKLTCARIVIEDGAYIKAAIQMDGCSAHGGPEIESMSVGTSSLPKLR